MAVMLMAVLACSALAQDAVGGVTIEKNDASKTGYTTTFTYYDDKATDVNLYGNFIFYEENDPHVAGRGNILTKYDSINNYFYGPDDWQKGLKLRHIANYTAVYETDMVKDEQTGAWKISLELPCAPYQYQYKVSYDGGENYTSIPDPANPPKLNAQGANESQSMVYVPYDEEKQDVADDHTWQFPLEDESKRGEVKLITYTGIDNQEHGAAIYLPAGYDPAREEPYKVLYLAHGGTGAGSNWFEGGNTNNIVDRLAAEGKTEEFIIVATNNSEFLRLNTEDPYNLTQLSMNVRFNMIPYMEENYNVSTNPKDRAFAGFSYGARVSTLMLVNAPEEFGYIAMFCGSAAFMWQDRDYASLDMPEIYLAGGFGDHLFSGLKYRAVGDNTILGLKDILDANDIMYNGNGMYKMMHGGHDWYTVSQCMKDFIETTLWK